MKTPPSQLAIAAPLARRPDSLPNHWFAGLGNSPRIYVVPEFKVVYVSAAKNACTTLKWAVASLAREDLSTFRVHLQAFLYEEQAVHSRSLFRRALMPHQVDPHVAADIHPDNGWFVFGVVRDPRTRLFSAWQDKLLLQEPGFQWAHQEPWYPRYPIGDADAIIADFGNFVETLASTQPLQRLRTNPHFISQSQSLDVESIPYTAIYSIEELSRLQNDLNSHVQRLGWTTPLVFRRSNATPLRANALVLGGGVRERIEDIYREDFEHFEDRFDFAKVENAPAWTDDAVREVRVRAELGRRLGAVRQVALDHRAAEAKAGLRAQKAVRRADRAEERADRAVERADELHRALDDMRLRLADAEKRERARAARRPGSVMKRGIRAAFQSAPARALLGTRAMRRIKKSSAVTRLRNAIY